MFASILALNLSGTTEGRQEFFAINVHLPVFKCKALVLN